MIHLDTETVGLTGPIVLIQYAYDDNPPILYHVWEESVRDTLKLIREITNESVCAFNLSFDWFHFNRLYNILYQIDDKRKPPTVDEVASLWSVNSEKARQFCLRPKHALDLLLYLRKTEWQNLMGRRPIRIRRVPIQMAQQLGRLLERKLQLPGIYFQRRPNGYEWEVDSSKDTQFPDLVLKFGATSALKPIITEIFKTNVYEYPIPKKWWPEEENYNPYTSEWTDVIDHHISWWYTDSGARGYAADDILHLQRLFRHFNCPKAGDLDSELAVCVGAVRNKGFSLDLPRLEQLYFKNREIEDKATFNLNSPLEVKRYLTNGLPTHHQIAIVNTSKPVLDKAKEVFPDTELAERITLVQDARKASKLLTLLKRLYIVGRFHPDFKVIGAKSGRMSGGGLTEESSESINPQGINRNKDIRDIFLVKGSGGDFDAFEVVIAHAASGDTNIEHSLKTGRKFHGELGAFFYDLPYEDVVATQGTDDDLYTPSKTTGFAFFYGAAIRTLARHAGISEARAEQAYNELSKKFTKYSSFREAIYDAFCSMRQPEGLGTEVVWHDPARYIETLLGFRRYFTLENRVCRFLFELAQDPKSLPVLAGQVARRDKLQTPRGATQSALYACAFQMQAQNMRAASNHVIQGTGAEICKRLQLNIWSLQPVGIHPWVVAPMNIHDEVIVEHEPDIYKQVKTIVDETVESFRERIPLLSISWKEIERWGDLK